LTAGTVQAESDARRFLGDVPVLGGVPFNARRRKRHALLSDAVAQANVSEQAPFDEAFRLLGLSLFRAQAEPQQQIIFITSPGWGDGKTSCALALGLALARRGRRVLIVDGSPVEFARSEAGHAEPSEETPALGLEDVLTGRSTLRAARVTVPAGLGQLHLLSAGTVNPDEPRATAEQLAEFLEVARARYDGMLVDVPGHLPTNVMAAIGLADRVLLVLRLRHTRRHRLAELLADLPRERAAALVIDERRDRAVRAFEPELIARKGDPVASRA
jgi:receptor protein-tyrosine kinase